MIYFDLYEKILKEYVIQYDKSEQVIGNNIFSDDEIISLSKEKGIDIDILKYVYSVKYKKNKKIIANIGVDLCLEKNTNQITSNNNFSSRKDYYTNKFDLYFSQPDSDKIYSISQNIYRRLLFENNNVLICPYCGKIGFIKRNNDKNDNLYSFELDHFLPKAEYPQFALSIYNLIPVCKICNQFIKGQRKFTDGYHFNIFLGSFEYNLGNIKYFEKKSFDDIFKFGLNINDKFKDFNKKISFWSLINTNDNKYQAYLDYLFLNNIYKYSPDTKSDYGMFINLRNIYLSGKNKNISVYNKNDLFKNWYPKESKDILKFTNGKMKKDLIERL